MLAFTMTVEQLELFSAICAKVGADTEEKRVLVALEMAQAGKINNLVRTSMDKEQYLEHLTKHFGNVLDFSSEKPKNGNESTDIGFKPQSDTGNSCDPCQTCGRYSCSCG